MKIKYLNILLLLACLVFSQDDKLRFETIDVFKNYSPIIANSIKINTQPIYNDTLQEKIIPNKPILPRNIVLRESVDFKNSSKYFVDGLSAYFGNYSSIKMGTHSFFSTRFHYNNGLSVRHNSGVYLELSSEDYGFQSPYYKKNNGEFTRVIQLYSNRFLKDKLFKTNLKIQGISGLYWGGLNNINVENIASYNISSIDLSNTLVSNSLNSFFKSANFKLNVFNNNYYRSEFRIISNLNLQTTKSLKKYSIYLSGELINSDFDDINQLAIIPENSNVNCFTVNDINQNSLFDLFFNSNFLLSGNSIVDYKAGVSLFYGKLSSNPKSNYVISPNLKFLKKIDESKILTFEFDNELKYHSFNDLFNVIPFINPYSRNFLTQELKASFSYTHLLTRSLSIYNIVSYNHIQNRAVPFLYDLYDNSMMNPINLYLTNLDGFDFMSSLAWSRVKYDFLLSFHLNSLKSNKFQNISFIANKINSTFIFKFFNSINIIADCYYRGDSDVLRFLPSADNNYSHVVLPSYVSANLSVRYMLKNMIFSLNLRNLLNVRYNVFDGYLDDDGFKLKFGFSYRF